MTIAKQYIQAAQRHKYVCEKLLNLPELDSLRNGEVSILDSSQEKILTNIYYLSGYVIECACSAAVYRHYSKLRHKKELNDTQKSISFNKNTTFRICGDARRG